MKAEHWYQLCFMVKYCLLIQVEVVIMSQDIKL